MTKSSDLKAQGLLISDPNDSSRSIVRIDISVLNVLIDDYNALELAAMGRGWDGQGDAADAVRFVDQWVKTVATTDVIAKLKAEVSEQAAEQFEQQIAGLF